MVLGLIWFLSHLWVVEVILASSFRKRERLWHFLRWRPLKADAAVELGKIQESPFLKRSKSLAAVKAKSLLRCTLHSLILSSSYSRSGCLPPMFDRFFAFGNFPSLPPFNESLLFWSAWSACFSLFSRCKFMRRRKKLSASLYQWKTVVPLVAPLSRHSGSSSERLEGFSLFKVQICFFAFFSILFFLVASWLKDNGYWVVRCRLHEIPADVFCTSFKDFLSVSFSESSFLFAAHSSWFSGDVLDVWKTWVGTPEFMKTWSRERQRVGSCRGGSKDHWVGSRARLKDVG